MRYENRCLRCDRVLIISYLLCPDCWRTLERQVLWTIAVLIPLFAGIVTWMVRRAVR